MSVNVINGILFSLDKEGLVQIPPLVPMWLGLEYVMLSEVI